MPDTGEPPFAERRIITSELVSNRTSRGFTIKSVGRGVIDSMDFTKNSTNVGRVRKLSEIRKRELVTQTLSEDYPGLDYLGIHGVLKAKNPRYQLIWFVVVGLCLIIGIIAILR